MATKQNAKVLQEQFQEAGHRIGIIVPLCVTLVCALGQLIFTSYFDNLSAAAVRGFGVMTISILCLILVEKFNAHQTKNWKRVENIMGHLIAIGAFVFLLPIPSPYLILVMMLSMLTYLDFGFKAMLVSLGSIFVILLARLFQMGRWHDHTLFGLYLVSYALIAVMTYFATIFLRVSRQEIHEVQRSSAKAVANEQQVQSLINNITDGVIALDQHYRVVIYNAAALDVLDLNSLVKGMKVTELLMPIDAEHNPVDVVSLLKNVTVPTVNRDLRIKYNDGSTANLFIGIAPIYLGYGKSKNNGFTLILRDITREKSLEEERDEFISVVSHELRTPIAISEGNISNAQFTAEKSGDMKVIKAALKEAHTQVLFLADMINDLSTLSRAERGALDVEVDSIDVQALTRELADTYRPEAAAKGLAIKTTVDSATSVLHSSKLYTREILQNFITNAIKYTDEGEVTISVKGTAKGVQFEVSDTGIGIGKADQDRVYDKFFRSEDFRTRKNNGTGLGLYVTMKLARLVHATISLESELNKGSTFTIIIPNLHEADATKTV